MVGPEGVGKTRLAREFALAHGGIVVLDDAEADAVGAERTVATARDPLGIPGERVYRVKPLGEAPAIELFRAHAEASEASYEELAALVRELGGLPAAIVRAAAASQA